MVDAVRVSEVEKGELRSQRLCCTLGQDATVGDAWTFSLPLDQISGYQVDNQRQQS